MRAAAAVRSDAVAIRGAIASSLRADVVDDAALEGLRSELAALRDQADKSLADAISEVHGALDASQRERLADLLERAGRGRPGGGGPYREATT